MENAPEYEKQKSRRLSQGESLRHRLAIVACVGLILFGNTAWPQLRTAAISGRVFGRFLRGGSRFPMAAVIRVRDLHGNNVKAVWADIHGSFTIDGLATGTYVVSVSKGYFVEQKRTIAVVAGKTVRLNVVLREPPPESDCPSKPSVPPFPTDLTSVKIRLERSSCLGSCPAYTIDISGDGSVKYAGIVGVQHLGPLSYAISLTRVRKLTKMFYKKAFFSLCKDYSVSWTDLPGTSTSIRIGRTTWTVDDYGIVGPKQLKSLNAFIDKLAGPPTKGQP